MAKSKNKNLGATRVFRERGQVGSRSRLGLLEKHKDYVHRARDYRSKQDRLKKLREKAAFRNKDEFYHGMIKSKTKDGVAYGDRGNVALDSETVKLLKTQDVGYIRMQIAKDQRKVEKLRKEIETLLPPNGSYEADWTPLSELAEIEKLAEMGIVLSPRDTGKKKGKSVEKHIMFAEEGDDLQTFGAGPSRPRSVTPEPEIEDLGWNEAPTRAIRRKPEISESVDEEAEEKQAQQNRLALYSALSAHLVRLNALRAAESKLASTLGLFGKGAAQKVRKAGWVDDETAEEDRNGEKRRFVGNVFKWKSERRK